jgi:magnesium-transporting ATPase (P-type)
LDNLHANPAMVGVTVLTILLQVAADYVPFLERFFHVVPLSAANFGICVFLGFVISGPVAIEGHLPRREVRASVE